MRYIYADLPNDSHIRVFGSQKNCQPFKLVQNDTPIPM